MLFLWLQHKAEKKTLEVFCHFLRGGGEDEHVPKGYLCHLVDAKGSLISCRTHHACVISSRDFFLVKNMKSATAVFVFRFFVEESDRI